MFNANKFETPAKLVSLTLVSFFAGLLFCQTFSNDHSKEVSLASLDHSSLQEVSASVDPARERQIECLAKNIYFEARGESPMGQVAVGLVTLNRVASDKYPSDPCKVVTQAKRGADGTPLRHKCQFSWYCDGNKDVIRDRASYEKADTVARFLFDYYHETQSMPDLLDGATHYHATSVNPRWRLAQVAKVDNHIFYKEKSPRG